MYKKLVKRFFDIVTAIMVLVISFPVLLIVSIWLFFANNGKVFFVQPRPGLNEHIFKIIKFKTMTDAVDASGTLLPDNERVTWIGKLVRKTSIDELPQFINVLKGDMSVVGPRPLLVEYLPRYNEFQKQRHLVRPGITGWAQVNGRNLVDWQTRFEMDVWYVCNQSFLLDLHILFLTFLKVFKAEGVSSRNSVTMEKFKGNA